MSFRRARFAVALASLIWASGCARAPRPGEPSFKPSASATGAGAGATPATAGGPAPTAGNASPVTSLSSSAGGYIASGEWRGFAFTSASGTGSTIEPASFAMRPAGEGLCASGTVGAAADYSGTALVGVNVDQDMMGGMPRAITPMKAGVLVQLKNKAGSSLRLQIQGPNGATDASDRWCAPIAATGGFVPWASFNTKCWDGSGMAYAKQPIVAAMVLVPGGNTAPVQFDFCIEALAAADGATASPSGATSAPAAGSGGNVPVASADPSTPLAAGNLGGSGMLTDKYGAAMVMRDGRSYFVQNNVWGDSTSQALAYHGTTFEITQQTGMNVSSGPAAMGPVSYPSSFIGSNYNRATSGSNLPKQVSALTSVKTGWSHNAGSVPGSYNAAYDVWFSTGASGDSQAPSGGYLMVWYSKPTGIQPIGAPGGAPVEIPGVLGSWEVWLGQNAGRPCISYVRTTPITSLEFDLNAFIKDAVARPGAIKAEWYLTNVFAGFEIWSGGVGLKSSAFYAIVQ